MYRDYLKSKIRIDANGCWLWTKSKRAGYGQAWDGSRVRTAHRMSYEAFVGLIPAGLLVLHKCDVRHCINPEHLYLGTQADNGVDMVIRDRCNPFNATKEVCKQGHPLSGDNLYVYPNGRGRACKICRHYWTTHRGKGAVERLS